MNRRAPFCADYIWDIITGISSRKPNPRFHQNRLSEPIRQKSPQLIIVAPHGDLCHEYVNQKEIFSIWQVITELAPWHQYMILTQFPERLLGLKDSLTWLPNLWIGVPLESPSHMGRLDALNALPAIVKFATFLPPREDRIAWDFSGLDWVIAGGGVDRRQKSGITIILLKSFIRYARHKMFHFISPKKENILKLTGIGYIISSMYGKFLSSRSGLSTIANWIKS